MGRDSRGRLGVTSSALLRGVVARLMGPRLAVSLLPGWVLVVLMVVQVQPMLDLEAVRGSVAAQGWRGDAAVLALSALLGPGLGWAAWKLATGQRALLALRRQPLTDVPWAGALAPWAMLSALVGVLPAVFWGGATGAVAAPVLVVSGAVVLLAAGGRAAAGLLAAVVLYSAALLALQVGWPLLVLVGALALWGVPPAVRVWRQPRPVPRRTWWRMPGRVRTPVEALARRDLLALSRSVPQLWSNVLLPAPLLGGAVWLSLERGVTEGHSGAQAAGIALCITSMVGAWALMELITLLGSDFDVRRLPLSPLERVLALSFTLETTLSLVTTAVVLACWRLDGSELMWLGLVAMTLSAGAQALACRFAETPTPGAVVSWQLWWALAVFAVLFFPWWVAVATYAVMTVGAWTFAVRSLQHKRRLHVARGA